MVFNFVVSNSPFSKQEILSLIEVFDTGSGKLLGKGTRNKIKIFELDSKLINIKSFKIPVLINKIAYRYFRKSKARRSFEYAEILLEKKIGTPQPIGFYERYSNWGLTRSFYISEHLNPDLTFRELITNPDYPDHENIMRQFTRFCFELHEKGIEFLDHSPGNTLIKKMNDGKYHFFLVDLNRMRFHNSLSLELRLKNLQRLTPKKEMIEIMSNEYAKFCHLPEEIIFNQLWLNTKTFKEKFERKKRLKKKLKNLLKIK